MQNISSLIEAGQLRYAALPLAARHSVLPFLLVSLPLVVLSLAGAYIVMPLVVGLTAYQLFLMTKSTDHYMFTLTPMQARLYVTFPLCMFVSAWIIGMSLLSSRTMTNAVVGPYVILLLIACAPAYRWNDERTKRRIPLWFSFSFAGTFAVIASLAHAF